MDNKEPERRNGFIKIPEEDWIRIDSCAEAWVDNMPFGSIYEFAKRWHLHILSRLFMEDRPRFDSFLEQFGITSDGERTIVLPQTLHMMNQMDSMVGFMGMQSLTDAEMDDQHPKDETPLPDAKFFEELGLN